MPSKRRLVTSEICFGTEKAGLLDFSYDKCALDQLCKKFHLISQKWPWKQYVYRQLKKAFKIHDSGALQEVITKKKYLKNT